MPARLSFLPALFAFFFLCAANAGANPPSHASVRADTLGFYADHLMLAAQGRVRARLGTRKIEADVLRYDLAHNTVLAAGNVRVSSEHGDFSGAAYALNLASGAGVLLKLDPLPATFAVHDDDITNAVEQPAAPDTFSVPDIGAILPYIASTHADIVSNASVRFTPARFPINGKLSVPSPSYLYVFAPNPAFGVTPPTLPAASFDQPYGLIGTTHSLLAAHLRYGAGGISTGIDEHLVDGLQRYLVASFEPNDRHFDVDGFEQLTPHLTQNFTGSLAEDEKSARYVLQRTSKLITTTLTLSQFAVNVTAAPIVPSSSPTPTPPNGISYASDDLQVNTVTRSIKHFLSYKLRTDFGYDNITGQLPYDADFRTTIGGSLYTPSIHGPLKTSISGEYDLSSTHYSYPHQNVTSSTLLTVSRRVSHALSFYGYASFAQFYDRYGSQAFTSAQINNFLALYPNPALPVIAPDGTPYPGYSAYNGVTTQRTYFLTTTISPNPNFNLLLSLTETRDFPQFHGFGRAPLTASFDLRIRPIRNIAVDLGRSYIFGWDLQHLTPQYTLGLSP